ncbi:hypothetical protein K490DRAFT_61829 [Saccharata proteae CBS 121410]|uniref:Uncharacterized protein n=1 Tax=Saccharata proteae CBS 121410 TaxID=1314787 RepID=A0A9P4I0H4_9PEZI|nr:hypothetical protein K490DRAFT_61829 [Saccharata proteae CBS 121410]
MPTSTTTTVKPSQPANGAEPRQRHSTQSSKPSPPSPTTGSNTANNNAIPSSSIPSILPKRTTVLLFRLLRLLITFTIVHVLFTGQLPGSSRLWDSSPDALISSSPNSTSMTTTANTTANQDTTAPTAPPKDPALKAFKLAEKAIAFGAFHLGRAFLESMIVDVFALVAVVLVVFRTEDEESWPVHLGSFWNKWTARFFYRTGLNWIDDGCAYVGIDLRGEADYEQDDIPRW